jgi:hypothetical protein
MGRGGKERRLDSFGGGGEEDNDYVGHNKAFFGGMRRRSPQIPVAPHEKTEQ